MWQRIIVRLQLNTVRKKVFVIAKITGLLIFILSLAATELLSDNHYTLYVLLALILPIIILMDFVLGKLITEPLGKINKVAQQMSQLDMTVCCSIETKDEFGELAGNLNKMFDSLKHAMQDLENANTKLAYDVGQKKRMLAQRKELVDTLSHEIKTPLGVIKAYAEGLSSETNPVKKQKHIQTILSEVDRTNHMLVTLLDLSALEVGAAPLLDKHFDFVEMVETIAGKLVIDTPNRNYRFSYSLPSYKVYIKADSHRIEQVISNLISNAVKHVQPAGELNITIEIIDDRLRFSVYNQGAAIANNTIPFIWKKFYRVKTDGDNGGSGLGLSIVAQVLTLYGADYGVTNTTNGVRFYFTFPISHVQLF